MKVIFLKKALPAVIVPTLAFCLFASVSADADDWMTDVNAETMWTDFVSVNTSDLGQSFQISFLDPIPYGSNWTHGYDRVSSVRATASLARPFYIYRNVYDNTSGNCYWNFADEDVITLPRGIQYTLVHEIIDGLGNVILRDEAPVTIGSGDPLSPVWFGPFGIDTLNVASGKNILLKPTDSISYSAKWAYNKPYIDKKITLTAVSQGESGIMSFFSSSLMSAGDSYTIMTSGTEGEGAYVWNYDPVDPGVLPRNDTYALNYSIFDAENPATVFQTGSGVTTFTLMPEPSLAFVTLLVLGLAGFRRRGFAHTFGRD